jgi:hypothetical protein
MAEKSLLKVCVKEVSPSQKLEIEASATTRYSLRAMAMGERLLKCQRVKNTNCLTGAKRFEHSRKY